MIMNVEVKRDGLTLRGTYVPVNRDRFDLAILMHGFTSDRGTTSDAMLYQIADQLKQNNVASLRFDFNGHGQSDGKFVNMTVLNEIADGKAILDYARSIKGVRRICLLGHSQGGVVASMLAGYYHDVIDKLVLMAPAATLKDDALAGHTRGLVYDPEHIPDQQTMSDGKVLGGFYLRTAQKLPIYDVARQYQGPVCLIHGTADQIVNEIASRRYDEVYQHDEFHLLANADHSFTVGDSRKEAVKLAVEFLKA